jgi:uncharacterized protein RhaS with RHS repeats
MGGDESGAGARRCEPCGATYYGNGYEKGGRTYVYAKDHLGSVREVLDATGTVVARYEYDFWGVRSKLGGSGETPLGYEGHYTQAETGLVLAPYRACDPERGGGYRGIR